MPANSIHNPHAATKRSGFTLIEVIATISVLAITLTLASRIIFTSMDGYAASATASRLVASISTGLEVAATHLRDLPASSENDGSPDITSISSTSINWGNSGSLRLHNGALELTPDEPSAHAQVLISNVTSLSILPLDATANALSLPLSGSPARQTRQIQISITAEQHGLSRTLRTRVFTRCAAAPGSGS
ncbi:MAG: type II secretion system protein [Phycisphaeraceae bacterium]|nr:type II secretion system protein [Phycisphaeraceae bacterium]